VVLAESDQDCRFYAAALEAAHSEERLPVAPHDVQFLPTNGKDGMAKLAEILTNLGVSEVASPDLDVIQDQAKLRKLVQSLGGDFEPLRKAYTPRLLPSKLFLTRGGVKIFCT
jgi:hypothetical protein